MARTLLPTLAIELVVLALVGPRLGVDVRRAVVIVAVVANVVTQALLWGALWNAGPHYLWVLGISEVGIWLLEAVAFAVPRHVGLTWSVAWKLSLAMNAVSFVLGLFLPI